MRVKLLGPRGVKNIVLLDLGLPREGMWIKNTECSEEQSFLRTTVEWLNKYLRTFLTNKHYAPLSIDPSHQQSSPLFHYLKPFLMETEQLNLRVYFQLCADDRLCKQETIALLKMS